ncbi:MAG TPA: YihY/virulence factor BrkB family protein [Acidimicrobiales bacterium]|nr:YihY/virulence factor BrkB family protein [Acidimicrobiales bacterium]
MGLAAREDETDHAPAGDGREPKPGSSGAGSQTADPREVARSEGDARGRFADSPTELPTAGWKDVVRRTLQEVKADNVPITAAGVAFYGMLALVPALVAIVSVYGLATSPEESARQVEGFTAALPGEAARLLVDQIKSITGQPSSGLGVKLALSLAGLLWSASSGTTALIRGLGIAYDEPEGRSFLKLRSRALLLTVAAVIGAVVVLGLTVALPAILDVAGLGSVGTTVGLVLRWPVLGALFIVGLAAVYRYGPDRDKAKWRWVSPGALVATVLWVMGTGLFGFYAGRFASYNDTYGTLAGAVVLLLWLYLTSLVILVGAELNSELERQTLEDSTVGRPRDLGDREAKSADTVGAAAPSRSKR